MSVLKVLESGIIGSVLCSVSLGEAFLVSWTLSNTEEVRCDLFRRSNGSVPQYLNVKADLKKEVEFIGY